MSRLTNKTTSFAKAMSSKDGGYDYGKLTILGIGLGLVIGGAFLLALYIVLF